MNPDAVIILGTFAVFGFILKIAILFNIEVKNEASRRFVALCLLFIMQNVSEFLGYFTYLSSPLLSELFLHIYIIVIYYGFPSMLLLALSIAKFKHLRNVQLLLYGVATIITLLHLNGWVVSGAKLDSWNVVSIPGPLYLLSVAFNLICAFITVAYLITQSITNDDYSVRFNCKVNIIAFLPLMTLALVIYMLRSFGFESSSAVSGSIATLSFMFIMLQHTNGNLFWFTTKIKSVFLIIRMNRKATVDEIINEIEKIRIQEALKLTAGKQKSAASILGVTPPTLNKRISRHQIDSSLYK